MSIKYLRKDPIRAIEKSNFFVVYDAVSYPLGGNVSIKNKTTRAIDILTIHSGGLDYYFPYNNTGTGIESGIGLVKIQLPVRESTVAVTGAMNGCALSVFHNQGEYTFVHDLNGINLKNDVIQRLNLGEQVCRIESSAYWPDPKIGHYNGAPTVPICQFICVFKDNLWHVGCFGIQTGLNKKTKKNTDVVSSFEPKGGKYRGGFNNMGATITQPLIPL